MSLDDITTFVANMKTEGQRKSHTASSRVKVIPQTQNYIFTGRTSHDFNIVICTRILFDLLHYILYVTKAIGYAKPQLDLAVDF